MSARHGPRRVHWTSSDWPRELYWAFNPGLGRLRPGSTRPPYTSYGYTIRSGVARQPWGRSTHARGYLSHVVRQVMIAWRSGQFRGAVAQWRCGSSTRFFELEAEPSGPICPLCTLERPYYAPKD